MVKQIGKQLPLKLKSEYLKFPWVPVSICAFQGPLVNVVSHAVPSNETYRMQKYYASELIDFRIGVIEYDNL